MVTRLGAMELRLVCHIWTIGIPIESLSLTWTATVAFCAKIKYIHFHIIISRGQCWGLFLVLLFLCVLYRAHD